MPLHIDIKVNESTIRRLHIARITSNGLSPDSINEYAVIMDDERKVSAEGSSLRYRHTTPDEWEWMTSTIRFEHRYGDDDLTCLMKAVEAVQQSLHQRNQ